MFLEQVFHPDVSIRQRVETMSLLLLFHQSKEDTEHRRQCLFNVGDNNLLELGSFTHRLQDTIEFGQRKHDFDIRIIDRSQYFIGWVGRIDCYYHATRFENTEERDHELRCVWHEDSHPVT